MFFTKTGRVYVEKVYEIPEMSRASKGRSIANFLQLQSGEQIAATLRIQGKRSGTGAAAKDETWNDQFNVLFVARSGVVKKSLLSDFANIRKGGIIAIKIEEGDELIDAKLTTGQDEIVLVTSNGISIRFHEEGARPMGRNAVGVWGIRLEKGDKVIGSALARSDAALLVAGENGIGKRTTFDEYRKQSRGGKGIITMKTGDKTGKVVGALTVTDADEIMLITSGGQMVRTRVSEIREIGRNAMGVKLIGLAAGEKLQAVAPVVSESDDSTDVAADSPAPTPIE
jgi:DNA gyrase subunit A